MACINRFSVLLLAMLLTSDAIANQQIMIDPPGSALPNAINPSGKAKVTINNRTFLVESTGAQSRAAARSPSHFIAGPLVPEVITKGMTIKNVATGSLATVTGRFSVLLNPGVDAEDFAKQFGLTIYRQMGNSRLYIFEAAEHVDILAIERGLQATKDAAAVKVELLENLMEPL